MATISQQRGRDNGEGGKSRLSVCVGRHNGPPASSSPGVLGDLGDTSGYFQRPRLYTVYFVDNHAAYGDVDASVLFFCFVLLPRGLFLCPFLNSSHKKNQQQHFYCIVDSTFSALSTQKLTLHDMIFQRNNPPAKKKKKGH